MMTTPFGEAFVTLLEAVLPGASLFRLEVHGRLAELDLEEPDVPPEEQWALFRSLHEELLEAGLLASRVEDDPLTCFVRDTLAPGRGEAYDEVPAELLEAAEGGAFPDASLALLEEGALLGRFGDDEPTLVIEHDDAYVLVSAESIHRLETPLDLIEALRG